MRSRVPFSVVAVILLILQVVVVGVVLWPRPEADSVHGPGAVVLESMPSAPTEQWELSARDVLGEESAQASLTIRAEADGMLVVEGVGDPYGQTSTLAAVDAESGEVLWRRRAAGRWAACAVSADGVLGCVKNTRDGAEVVARVYFLDLASGAEHTTRTAAAHGVPSLVAIGTAFVVSVARDRSVRLREEGLGGEAPVDRLQDRRPLITQFASTGQRSWTVDGDAERRHLRAVAGSGLFVMRGDADAAGFAVYRADSGRRIYSTPEPLPVGTGCPPHGDEWVVCTAGRAQADYVLYRGGFAVGGAEGAEMIAFNDYRGVRTGTLTGWSLRTGEHDGAEPYLVPRDRIPVTTGRAVGVVTADSATLRWSRDLQASAMRSLGGELVAIAIDGFDADDRFFRTWRIVESDTGEQGATVVTRFGRSLLGYDGRRVIFADDPDKNQRLTSPRLTAYDAQTGRRRWTITSAKAVTWQRFGSSLYTVTASGPASIARYTS